MTERRSLYPELEPYDQGMLKVSDLHTVYYEQSGNPNGKPVVFLHGGPGGGSSPKQRRFFDPERYRIVLFDQRGCGRSTPHAELRENTTWDLVSDIDRLRKKLGIDAWMVFGGSWGSTLALSYAQTHPEHITELVLRGIFLLRPRELQWFYQEGTSRLFPEAWQDYLAAIPEAEHGDLMNAYYKRLTCDDPAVRQAAARAWSVWEGSTSHLLPDDSHIAATGQDDFSLAFARIECHYFKHAGFFEDPEQLLRVDRHRHIPAIIVQGRYDVVCPAETAWHLKQQWPEAKLEIIADAGHSAFEPGIIDALVRATDEWAERRS